MAVSVYLVSTSSDISGIHGTQELGHTQVGRLLLCLPLYYYHCFYYIIII